MKKHLFIIALLSLPFLSKNGRAQYADVDNYQGAFVGQLGGQFFYAAHYEYAFVRKEHFSLASSIGFGRNEYSDDVTHEPAIRGIDAGLTGVGGAEWLFFEAGLHPTTYFFGKNTFINLNGWFGPRVFPFGDYSSVCLGYTPRIYTSFSDPTDYFLNAKVGLKAVIVF